MRRRREDHRDLGYRFDWAPSLSDRESFARCLSHQNQSQPLQRSLKITITMARGTADLNALELCPNEGDSTDAHQS